MTLLIRCTALSSNLGRRYATWLRSWSGAFSTGTGSSSGYVSRSHPSPSRRPSACREPSAWSRQRTRALSTARWRAMTFGTRRAEIEAGRSSAALWHTRPSPSPPFRGTPHMTSVAATAEQQCHIFDFGHLRTVFFEFSTRPVVINDGASIQRHTTGHAAPRSPPRRPPSGGHCH